MGRVGRKRTLSDEDVLNITVLILNGETFRSQEKLTGTKRSTACNNILSRLPMIDNDMYKRYVCAALNHVTEGRKNGAKKKVENRRKQNERKD